jgi:leucine dehydrogenase
MGMKAAAKEAFGSDSMSGKRVSVQGVGHVGEYLVGYLAKEGAKIFISDIHEDTLARVANKYGATVVGTDEIYDQEVDVYAPCALGATVNDETLSRLKTPIIAGAANNQLKDEKKHGEAVLAKGIIYAPDYAINSGGIINCYTEVKGLNAEWAMQNAENVYNTILAIIKESKATNTPTYLVANRMAEQRIEAVGKLKRFM